MEVDTKAVSPTLQQERRGEQRFPLQLPILIKAFSDQTPEQSSVTRDVSARGAFFLLDSKLPEGTPIELLLTLPAEITLTENIDVRCKGKIVRVVESTPDQKVGIAAVIERYDFTHA